MKDEILKLKREGLTHKEIINKLGCAKSTISYHCNKNGLGDKTNSKLETELINKIKKYYINHTINETAIKFNISETTVVRYVDKKRVLLSDEEKKYRNRERVKNFRKKIKLKCVEYKGGQCEKCGYNKCIDVLEFHHLDPTKKDFGIASKGHVKSWDNIKKELDKCIMVCANCHREIHYEINNPQ